MSLGEAGRIADQARTPLAKARPKPSEDALAAVPQESFEPGAEADEKAWTFLFYNVGQGNLSSMTTHVVNQLEQVGSDENTNLLALNYRERPVQERILGRHKAFEGARSYFINKHPKRSSGAWLGEELGSLVDTALSTPATIESEVIATPAQAGEASKMSQAETLKTFLLESMARYPAKNYGLIITGHGAAFQGQAITRGPEGRAALSNDALGQTLQELSEDGHEVGLVNLNTCYSANLETIFSLKDATQAIVASQAELALGTQPFAAVLSEVQRRLREKGQVGASEVAQIFVEQARAQPLHDLHSPSLSAFDSSQLGSLGAAVHGLQEACLKAKISPATLRECLANAVSVDFAQQPRHVELTDLGSLARVISERVDSPAVRKAALEVENALSKAVLAEQHSVPSQESSLSKLVRRLPFLVGPQKSLEGASGITVFWDPQEARRLEMIAGSAYGQAHPLQEFMSMLGSDDVTG